MVDYTRNDGSGFVGDQQRLCVATTREKYVEIYLMPCGVFPEGRLSNDPRKDLDPGLVAGIYLNCARPK